MEPSPPTTIIGSRGGSPQTLRQEFSETWQIFVQNCIELEKYGPKLQLLGDFFVFFSLKLPIFGIVLRILKII